jgi:DsbC/DsbD-like thiol-disulfide interchange protein
MQLRAVSAVCALMLLAVGAQFAESRIALSPQDSAALPNAAAIVTPHTYVSLEPVPAGKEFQAAVVVDIARGFHMNSHKPSDQYLIPTTLTPQVPAGIELVDTIYPAGKLEKFAFSPDKPLDVYTGSVTLRLRLAAKASAAQGSTTIPMTLRYQACNDSSCLPPVKVPVSVKFELAAAGARSRAVHPEIFAENSPKN